MENWLEILIAVFTSVLASSGLWAYLTKRLDKKDVRTQMLVGLGHDRIVSLGMKHLERGYITKDDYENLHDYLYVPYKLLGGNGSAEKIMNAVEQLPIQV